jgi:L-asparaginase II
VHAVVADSGGIVAHVGDPSLVTFYRSAAKPFQALPLVDDGAARALGLSDEELALCCASHSGEERHLTVARSILRKAGLEEGDLELGAHPPKRKEDADRLTAEGREPTRIHNNCSGKHAGMLALAVHHGWPTKGYLRPEHPVQRRMLSEISRWTGRSESTIGTGTDGCGVVCFAVPLVDMASSFARLGKASDDGTEAGPRRIVGAMADHPHLVAGTGRPGTILTEVAGDRVVVKTGAEGVFGGLLRGRGIGIAVKVEDGGQRASGVALLRVLELLGVLTEAELGGPLAELRRPAVRNTLGDVVGSVRAAFDFEGAR